MIIILIIILIIIIIYKNTNTRIQILFSQVAYHAQGIQIDVRVKASAHTFHAKYTYLYTPLHALE
jgi:hypothetical protein